MHADWQRPQEIAVTEPVRAFPATQFMVRVLLQQMFVQRHKVQLEVQVVVPDHEPVPPVPKYCPHVPLVARPRDALARCARERPSCANVGVGLCATPKEKAASKARKRHITGNVREALRPGGWRGADSRRGVR